jgi:hypothetical protein
MKWSHGAERRKRRTSFNVVAGRSVPRREGPDFWIILDYLSTMLLYTARLVTILMLEFF